ncbi:DUF2835 domain-containing protein [Neptuniibacter halophilus]|uniref:DUF2835 domain-containing protein n=1 Tax=Neptuniibacter halophilus TaxID=651666 RepID=UPI002572C63B|nr:DUF2835 domain-containing protein [Neptuniibacter halophilus]
MKTIIVDLHISPEKYKLMYQGVAQSVITRAIDGRKVRFPANILQPFLLRDGIRGRFCIRFTDQGKYQSIEKIA